MTIELRNYQMKALEKIKWSLTMEDDVNDLLQLPTGSGKSIVIAKLAEYLDRDVLILQPSVEILEQNKEKLLLYVDEQDINTYSASAGEKKINKYTFATIGSVYKDPELFAHFSIFILDEAHLLNPKDTGSMFQDFINSINKIRSSNNLSKIKVIGFTATPYRIFPTYFFLEENDTRTMYQANSIKVLTRVLDKKGGKPFWGRMLFSINNEDLFNMGYLSPLTYIDKSEIKQDMIPINKSGTDFDMDKYDRLVKTRDTDIINLIDEASKKHKHILVFCNSLSQMNRLQQYFNESLLYSQSLCISSETKKTDRKEIIRRFKSGEVQIVFNVGVLTTGFDFPELDCIVLLRPTRSIALYYQMLGRGLRIHKSKTSCFVYDWTDTVKRLGKVETIKLDKVDGKWNVTTETKPTGWHGVELYRFVIKELEIKK